MDEKKKIPDFSGKSSDKIPERFRWKTEDIFKSVKEWKKSFRKTSDNIEKLIELVSGWTENSENMYKFLDSLSSIRLEILKLHSYSSLKSDTFLNRSEFISMKGEVKSLHIKTKEITASLEEDIINLGEGKFKQYKKEQPGLDQYSRMFNSIFDSAGHILKGEVSKVASLTELFSETPGDVASIFRNLEIPKPEIILQSGKRIKLGWQEYVYLRNSASREEREKVFLKFWGNQFKFRNTFAALLDGSVKKEVFNAKIKNYSGALDAALSPEKIDIKIYKTLIKSVRKNLPVLHKYLVLKKKMLKLNELRYSDLYASSVKNHPEREYDLSEAKELIKNSLKPLGDDYHAILNSAFNERWIDFYPCRGKISGAYSLGLVKNIHPFILMNYNGKFSSVSTLSHELGHAIHSYLSNKTQPFPTADYPVFLAEIASTFNENLLIHHYLKVEKNYKIIASILEQYIENYRTTLFRQTLFAEFELLIHTYAGQGKTLTADFLDREYLKLTREYYGHDKGIVKIDDYICSEWSAIPHFFHSFYVYQYATGIIASGALTDIVLNGNGTDKYLEFLSSGNSDYSLKTLQKTGVNFSDDKVFNTAFKRLSDIVSKFENCVS